MHQDTHVLGGAKNRLLQKLVKDGGGGAVRVHITSASSAVAGSALDTPTLKAIEACQVTCTLDCRLAVRTLEIMPNSKIPPMQIVRNTWPHMSIATDATSITYGPMVVGSSLLNNPTQLMV